MIRPNKIQLRLTPQYQVVVINYKLVEKSVIDAWTLKQVDFVIVERKRMVVKKLKRNVINVKLNIFLCVSVIEIIEWFLS